MIYLFATFYMAAMARASGGGLNVTKLPIWCNRVPELLFALPFGYAAFVASGSVWCGLACWLWSFIAMELGHGNAYHMGAKQHDFPDRRQTLDYLVWPLCHAIEWAAHLAGKKLEIAPRSAIYCWVFMGLKGLLIGLPAYPFGIALAVLWPLAYWISFVILKKDSAPAEWISGASAGILLACAL